MPCFNLSTNVSLDGVDTADFFSEATKAVASIIGKPENVCIFSYSLIDMQNSEFKLDEFNCFKI